MTVIGAKKFEESVKTAAQFQISVTNAKLSNNWINELKILRLPGGHHRHLLPIIYSIMMLSWLRIIHIVLLATTLRVKCLVNVVWVLCTCLLNEMVGTALLHISCWSFAPSVALLSMLQLSTSVPHTRRDIGYLLVIISLIHLLLRCFSWLRSSITIIYSSVS